MSLVLLTDAMWIHRVGSFFVVAVVALLLRTVLVPVLEQAFRSQKLFLPTTALAYSPAPATRHPLPQRPITAHFGHR